MITVQLQPQSEKLARENPYEGLKRWPLYHQMRTARALQQYDVVMNTYNTGTGKTIASLLHLFDLKSQNVLFIAPTNALLEQHATDIEQFVNDNQLDFEVRRVTAASVRELEPGERPGKVLHKLIRNYLEYEEQGTRRRPLILVMNPDIFYYAMFVRYHRHDRRNLQEDFLLRFNYVVIDEFHYYDEKQLANFLFVLALFDQFGYFEGMGRKVCLLSATPTPRLRDYLNRLFCDRWRLISPHNEPQDAAELKRIPALAPLTLTLIEGDLTEWVGSHQAQLLGWLDAGLDGAIISSSLWRVNHAHRSLRGVLADDQLGRITGPERAAARREATARALILASPTVDIGYNFEKKKKRRQNVDFLVCDARYRDDLLQRIGRAGRVLGKDSTTQESCAVGLLPAGVVEELSDLDAQTVTRAAFNERINNCRHLPPRHNLTRYIETHAITECFYPIFRLGGVMPMRLHGVLETLFDRVCDVFGADRGFSYKQLKRYFFKYQDRQRWQQSLTKDHIPATRETAVHLADWLEWQEPEQGRPDPRIEIEPILPELLDSPETRLELLAFVQGQVALTDALFSFRDSFQGPQAVIYDPGHLLSSETTNRYDLFHLLRHYQLSPPLTRQQFEEQYGQTSEEGDFYFELRGWRDEKRSVEFALRCKNSRDKFEALWCHRPVAVAGLQIRVREQGGDVVSGGVVGDVAGALANRYLPALIITPDASGVAYARLKDSGIWSRRLTVHFSDGSRDDGYSIFLGTAAFFAHAELRTHFWLREKMKGQAIIL